MSVANIRLLDVANWVLVFCAILTTALVVRRELAPGLGEFSAGDSVWTPKFVDEWQSALRGGTFSGNPSAPVQVVEFADFQCPYCVQFEETVANVREKYPNEVAFTFVHLPLANHEYAEAAAMAAECAHQQGQFDEMRSALFARPDAFGEVSWTSFANRASVPSLEQFERCLAESQPADRIAFGKTHADLLGVRGTPTIIINGWKWPIPPTAKDFETIIDNVAEGRDPVDGIDYLDTDSGD